MSCGYLTIISQSWKKFLSSSTMIDPGISSIAIRRTLSISVLSTVQTETSPIELRRLVNDDLPISVDGGLCPLIGERHRDFVSSIDERIKCVTRNRVS